jgi:hypothetical protein
MFLFVCVFLSWLSFRKPSYVSLFVCPALLFIYRCLLSSCPDCPSYRLSYVYLFGCPASFPRTYCHLLLTVLPIDCPVCPFWLSCFISLNLLSSFPDCPSYRLSYVYLFGCPASFPWTYCPLVQPVLPIGCPALLFWLSCFISKNLLPSSPYCPSYWLSCMSFLAVLLFCKYSWVYCPPVLTVRPL